MEEIEGFAYDEVDDLINRCWSEIEPGVRGADDPAREGDRAHVLDIDQVERRFTMRNDEFSSFFERDRSCAGEQVRSGSSCNRAKGC